MSEDRPAAVEIVFVPENVADFWNATENQPNEKTARLQRNGREKPQYNIRERGVFPTRISRRKNACITALRKGCGARPSRRITNYHTTGSFRIVPSEGLTLPGSAALYCTQSIVNGAEPVLRTVRFPAGATRTTVPSFTGIFFPST